MVGFVALLGDVVGGLFVDPTRHGCGIGRALVLHAAERRGGLAVDLYEANAGARAFFRRLGFIEKSRQETDAQKRPHPLLRLRRPG